MRLHYVYRTTCLPTGKWYVGISYGNPTSRSYLGSGQALRGSIKKHGASAHVKRVLVIVQTRREASRIERALVGPDQVADPMCLNLHAGGYGAPLGNRNRAGKKLSPEHIEAIRQANLGNQHSKGRRIEFTPERCVAISKRMKGNKNQRPRAHTEETKKRISEANKGKVVSEGTRVKLSARRGWKHSPETIQKMSEARRAWWGRKP